MFQLTAQGTEMRQRWRSSLAAGRSYELGRDVDADLPVPWDPHVSRRHARLVVRDDRVEVEPLHAAANAVFFDGQPVERCAVRDGEHFVIGGTSFQLIKETANLPSSSAHPVEEVTFERHELKKVRIRDADKRINVLANLPEVIEGARSESEFHLRLVNLILTGVGHAEAAAIVRSGDAGGVEVLHWDRRRETAGEFRPSSRLVAEALQKRNRSVLHVWEASGHAPQEFTAMAEFDWAFCTPVAESDETPWGIYVAGKLGRSLAAGEKDEGGVILQSDVKFTEIVAEIVSSVRRSNELERLHSGLQQFFSKPVLSAIGEDLDTDILEPRECDVTVLFCDLRGFSQRAEEAANDLLGLLGRVSSALEVMTHHILLRGGVTGDFQGDAALGFWGWPFASDEAPLDACRAALGIRAAFAATRDQPHHPLANFEMGIGIAHGRAVAGKIGTSEQVKVTVFGPVVNLASRLESMTKQLRVPIVLDEATSDRVRKKLDPREGRLRRLAKVQPYGMETPVMVSELLPSELDYPELTDAHLATYEAGVDEFIAGRWDAAYRKLHAMPAADRAQDFLGLLIAQHNRVAPPGWDGVVRLSGK